MLNRAKVLRELETITDKLFLDLSPQKELARKTWQKICADPLFIHKIKSTSSPWALPQWSEKLDAVHEVLPHKAPYQLVSVDGSQIYPDRHQGTSCFLLNIAAIELQYGTGRKGIICSSEPYVFVENDADNEKISPQDIVNCKREEFELRMGLEKSFALKNGDPLYFLFDGSLIFWHLDSKEQALRDYFLKTYNDILLQFKAQNLSIAGYISMPKSKEMINLLRVSLCDFECNGCTVHLEIKQLVDTSICAMYLAVGQRTTMFKSMINITKHYPPELHPYFCYINVGAEIGRIEVPAYIALDDAHMNAVCSMVYDQVQKGQGYPVALAEAHEHAVVKGPDREFFYHMITKLGMDRAYRNLTSQKSIKKRGISV